MKHKQINILDCTFRDGGYYNNWEFDEKQIENYINAINKSGINYIEIGFRFENKDKFLGPFAFSTDSYIKKLKFDKKINLALMINCNDLINNTNKPSKLIDSLFVNKKSSPFSIVRLAAHFYEIPKAIKYVKKIKKKGYKVFLNLMQSSNKNEKDFKEVIDIIKNSKAVDVIYFADSLGSMKPINIREKCFFIKKYWNKEFGIHAHNNCNLAIKNSIKAIECGATWIDTTILGMGRGAGNAATEIIIKENTYFKKIYNLKPLAALSKNVFTALKTKYNWGASTTYAFAAKHNIHPTYVQVLENELNKNKNYVINILNKIKNTDLISYNPLSIQKYFENEKINLDGCWNAQNWCKNENLLILGKGTSIIKYKDDLIEFINKNKPRVLSLNFNKIINQSHIDYYVVSNQEKIIIDFKNYYSTKKKIIIPKSRFLKIFPNKTYKKNFLDYGLKISNNNKLSLDKYFCTIPSNIVLFYALSLAIVGNAKNIYLAGFDGYGSDDPREIEINKNLDFLSQNLGNKLTTITPSSYNIRKSSLYAHI